MPTLIERTLPEFSPLRAVDIHVDELPTFLDSTAHQLDFAFCISVQLLLLPLDA
jgi:hypothetical protein